MREWLLPPNLLTLARIALTPFIGLGLARGDARSILPLVFIAGISDALDGYLARRFHWTSALGEKLDPIADKFLLAVAYLALWQAGTFPTWLIVLVLGRDVLILSFAAVIFAFTSVRRLPPTIWGKLSTVCQMTLAGIAILAAAMQSAALSSILGPALIPATAAATAWSALHYAWTGWRLLCRENR